MEVACILPTADRPEMTLAAIECYRSQDYPAKQLLIFDNGKTPLDLTLHPGEFYVRIPSGPLIGDLRNQANEYASQLPRVPDALAHFDSDDWSAPGRLTDQVQRILVTGKSVTGYRTMRFTDGLRCWRYEGTPEFALGTSLFYKREWWNLHRFQPIQVAEDNLFGEVARAAHEIAVSDAGDMMFATVHPGNTSPRDIRGCSWTVLCSSGCSHG